MFNRLVSVALFSLLSSSVLAVPVAVPYSGYLSFDTGAPFDGSVDISVEVWSESTGGSLLWGPHLFNATPVDAGMFALLLGGATSPDLATALDSGQSLWLRFEIGGAVMDPRQQVLSVPFARRAESAAYLGALPASSYAVLGELPNAALSGSFNDLTDVPSDLVEAAGSTGALPKFSGASALDDSIVTQAAGNVGVDVASPQAKLHVGGAIQIGADDGTCDASRAGSLRWTGTAMELCDGEEWAALGSAVATPPGPGTPTTENFTIVGSQDYSSAGTFTFTVPTGIERLRTRIIGAGGNGSNGQIQVGGNQVIHGGGGGGYSEGVYTVSAGQSYTLVVGATGALTEVVGLNSATSGQYGGSLSPTSHDVAQGGVGQAGAINFHGGNGGVGTDNGGAAGGGAATRDGNGVSGAVLVGAWNTAQNGGASGSGTAGGISAYSFATAAHGQSGGINGGGGGAASYNNGGNGGTAGGGGSSAGYSGIGGTGGTGMIRLEWGNP